MKRVKLEEMTIDRLVERFAEIGTAQDMAERDDDIGKYNLLYWEADAVEKEIRSRDQDARRTLLQLYDHPNMQVRLNAATATLAVAPEKARGGSSSYQGVTVAPQAMHAGMLIRGLGDGSFKPT